MSDTGFLPTVARHLGLALAPLADAVSDLDHFEAFMLSLGWSPDDLPPEYVALGADVETVVQSVETLVDDPTLEHAQAAFDAVRRLYLAVTSITSVPAGVDPAGFLEEFGERAFELLLIDYLAQELPDIWSWGKMTGVISITTHKRNGAVPAYTEKRLHLDRIPSIVADPLSLPTLIFGWGTADLDFPFVVDHLHELALALRIPAAIERVVTDDDHGFAMGIQQPAGMLAAPAELQLRFPIAQPVIEDIPVMVDLVLVKFPAEGGKFPGVALRPSIPSSLSEEVELGDDLKLKIQAGSDIAGTFGIVVRPGEVLVRYPFAPGTQPPQAGFGVSLDYNPATPAVLLGSAGASRLELKGAESGLSFAFTQGELELILMSEVHGLQAVLALGDQDSFLGSLFGGKDLTIPVQLGVRWSNKRGFTFVGGAGFEVTVSPHLSLGPITVDTVHLAVLANLSSGGTPPALSAGADVGIHGALGPIGFTVDGVGVTLTASFTPGNAGPFDLSAGFKPPTGLGVSIDTGLVTGGGFLSYDSANGRYAGILQLRIAKVGVTAIGLLDTKLPQGGAAYSFLIIIAATFPPIQLGYGFTLNGAGGLAGVNRSVAIDVVQAGIRNGSIEHVMFPDNPVANANQIISDIRSIFPPAPGRFVFGPMALIGWCTPTLIHINLGIVLEYPAPIRLVLLGSMRMTLPNADDPLVELHVDAYGVLDLEALRLSVDALLHDSHVAAFAISGEMAFLLDMLEPALLLAIGGVNPHYQPPAGFPTLQAVTVSLGSGDNPRITLKGYVAKTANTSQIGALAELYAEYGGFNIYGWIGFDALFSFIPFGFITDFSGGVKLSRGSSKLAGVQLSATLAGVYPFHAKGRACVSLWLFDVCVGFDHTFGGSNHIDAPTVDPTPILQAALADPANWSGTLPPAAWRAVSVTTPPGETRVLIDPVGGVMLRERVLPLNRRITKFGEGTPSGPGEYDVTAVRVGSQDVAWVPVQDQFAPAQFEDYSDADKLSLPSFAKMDAGVELAGTAVTVGGGLGTDLVYETRIVDRPWGAQPAPGYTLPLSNQLVMVASSAAARSPFRRFGGEKFSEPRSGQGKPVAVVDEAFVIAGLEDLAVRDSFGTALSQHDAFSLLARHYETHPEDRGRLQVVPLTEAVAHG